MSAPVNGTELIRRALRSWAVHGGLATIARDLGISLTQLDAFTYHGGWLPATALRPLAEHIFQGHTEFVAETNKLRAVNRNPALPGPVRPDPYRRTGPPLDCTVIRGPASAAPPPVRQSRPGWE
jgi:hypothetical protein